MKNKTKKAIQKHLKKANRTVDRATDALRGSSDGKARKAAAAGAVALGAAGLAAAALIKTKHFEATTAGSGDDASQRSVLRVESDGNGGWILASNGEAEDRRFDTKREAVKAGRQEASGMEPSRLIVHRRDGRVQRTHEYG